VSGYVKREERTRSREPFEIAVDDDPGVVRYARNPQCFSKCLDRRKHIGISVPVCDYSGKGDVASARHMAFVIVSPVTCNVEDDNVRVVQHPRKGLCIHNEIDCITLLGVYTRCAADKKARYDEYENRSEYLHGFMVVTRFDGEKFR